MKKVISVLSHIFKKKTGTDSQNEMFSEDDHRSFSDAGDFLWAFDFEDIWVAENPQFPSYSPRNQPSKNLTDKQYIDYKLWSSQNWKMLYKKHYPFVHVVMGENPNIIFSAMCLGCKSQDLHGIERCIGCSFFRQNTPDKSHLRISGGEAATMTQDEFDRIIKDLGKH